MQDGIESEIRPNRIQVRTGKAMDPLSVSVTEAARLLGISRPKVYELIRQDNGIKAFHVGTRTLIPLADLRQWIHDQTNNIERNDTK